MAPNDSRESRISADCPANIAELLNNAWNHDLAALKPLLRVPGPASVQDPTTGETPLHAAVRACSTDPSAVDKAAAVVSELFMSGAIWNDVDNNNETPGCVAGRLGLEKLYTACMEAGVRAELLFGLLDGYEELESENAEDEMLNVDESDIIDITNDSTLEDGEEAPELVKDNNNNENNDDEEMTTIVATDPDRAFKPTAENHTVTSRDYLASKLTYTPDGSKLLDSADNGVMMSWETSIMRSSVDSLLGPSSPLPSGKKILNIGFGMGIIDTMFASTHPSVHHIIEAHPAVLQHISSSSGTSNADSSLNFGLDWESSAPTPGAYKIHAGKWQEIIPKLAEEGQTYDAIYFDTFGEDYNQLRNFFTEYVPYILTEGGAFGFFNGLGADRKICYDVYTKVSEMHLSDAGLDVEWQEIAVDMKGLGEDGKGEWEGVVRRYWTLEKYQLPRCTLMG